MAKDKTIFTLEEIPSFLYGFLDQILAQTQYQNLRTFLGSSDLEVELTAKGNPPLCLVSNYQDQTIDIYHPNQKAHHTPYLIVKVDTLFSLLQVIYLKQPHIPAFELAKNEDPVASQFYTLGWLIFLSDKGYK